MPSLRASRALTKRWCARSARTVPAKCAMYSGARLPARLQLFRTLPPAQHHARIAREAHSLKSAAGTFGYVRLAALALRLEKSAERLGDGEFRDLLDLMDAAYAAARAQEPQG
ncbi:HPt (histidine-containing phosphotransfer) domain-containing protein [Bradyrhizobium ottawaense]